MQVSGTMKYKLKCLHLKTQKEDRQSMHKHTIKLIFRIKKNIVTAS